MSSCMASHFPPPENDGGGAAATASSTAWISAVILSGSPSRKSMAGTGRAGSSSLWRWKKWISQGSGTSVTASQARDKLLNLSHDRPDRGEFRSGQRPRDRDSKSDLAVRNAPVLVEYRLERRRASRAVCRGTIVRQAGLEPWILTVRSSSLRHCCQRDLALHDSLGLSGDSRAAGVYLPEPTL